MRYPKSPFDSEGGLVHFPRMLDKIRLNARGELGEAYLPRLGKGMDRFLCDFLGVAYADVVRRVEAGGSDAEVLRWCFETGRRPSENDLLLFNKFLLKLGWRDEDLGITARLADYKREAGLSHRDDLQTVFDFIEVDEGRKP